MNIMLVSVTERTKEIWIRKAIWAWKIDIILQFLTEASMLSLIWWIVWIVFSFLSVEVINKFWLLSIITLDSIILSFWFSVLIGLIFWLLPAIKASKLRPIDALRFE
jgi:ABC-type antimicrobial peptide transport system permease subunit